MEFGQLSAIRYAKLHYLFFWGNLGFPTKRDYDNTVKEDNKREILQVCGSLNVKLGGPTRAISDSFSELSRRFHTQVLVFGTIDKIEISMYVNRTFRDNRYGFVLPRPNSEARKEIRDAQILLIHGFYLASTIYSLYYSKTRNIFLMPHGSLEKYERKKSKIRKFFFRKVISILSRGRTIHFMVGSNAEVTAIREIFPQNPISVANLGVGQKILISNYRSAKSQNMIQDSVTLGCISRIAQKKRIDLCIRSLEMLNRKGGKYNLRIFGTGDPGLEKELRKLVSDLNLNSVVTFEGFVENDAHIAALQEIDILLLPSENENFAIAVAESIASGKPVVVSRYVAMHEFVELHKTGIAITSLDVELLSTAIQEIVVNYDEYQRNCHSAAKFLSWNSVIENWIQIFDTAEVTHA